MKSDHLSASSSAYSMNQISTRVLIFTSLQRVLPLIPFRLHFYAPFVASKEEQDRFVVCLILDPRLLHNHVEANTEFSWVNIKHVWCTLYATFLFWLSSSIGSFSFREEANISYVRFNDKSVKPFTVFFSTGKSILNTLDRIYVRFENDTSSWMSCHIDTGARTGL